MLCSVLSHEVLGLKPEAQRLHLDLNPLFLDLKGVWTWGEFVDQRWPDFTTLQKEEPQLERPRSLRPSTNPSASLGPKQPERPSNIHANAPLN